MMEDTDSIDMTRSILNGYGDRAVWIFGLVLTILSFYGLFSLINDVRSLL